ncbi:MAG: hypothetical protein HYV63_06310 [Candidatus Schekmanbacteria bacterium]|nr:hypothetical protein [Candidatus Schekmanbacteria bacterium]
MARTSAPPPTGAGGGRRRAAAFFWRAGLLLVGLLLVCAVSPASPRSPEADQQPTPDAARLAVMQTVALPAAAHGLDGRLELLADTRLTAALRDELWGTGGEGEEPGSGAPASWRAAGFASVVDLQPAMLQTVDSAGAVRDRWPLERPLARIEAETLAVPGLTAWLVTVDYTTAFGSYSGPITFLFAVQDGRLRGLEAADESGATVPISLMRSLKTDWRLVPRRGGDGQDIVSVATRPNLEQPGSFVVMYRRISFDGNRWTRRLRLEAGFWEADGDFPPLEKFP